MALVIISAIAVAQESATKVQRQGNNFIQTSEKSISAHSEAEDNSTIINYTFTTKDGVGHQLHMGKSGGIYYWTISKKGNEYKVYVKDEKIISQIHNELGFKKEWTEGGKTHPKFSSLKLNYTAYYILTIINY